MKTDKIFEPLAKTALELKEQLINLEELNKSETDSLNKEIRKKQISIYKKLLDACFRQSIDFVPAGVSKAAKKYCDNNSLGNIFEYRWSEQVKYEKKKKRTECKLKYEHKIPVKELINRLKTVKSFNDALDIFMQQEIVWVTKDEDNLLRTSVRPDPDEEYRRVGIEVFENPNPASHFFKKNQRKRR